MIPRLFKPAKKISTYSDHPQFKIGAAIFHKSKLISTGHNVIYKTHPYMKRFHEHKTLHAELAAILPIRNHKDISSCIMVTYREDKSGNLAMSRPCKTCQQIIRSFGIKKMTYTIKNGWAEEELK